MRSSSSRKSKKKFHLYALGVLFAFFGIFLFVQSTTVHASVAESLYVSPNGNDNNPGTFGQPLLTIARARDLVRTMNQSMTGDITVFLRGGTHILSNTLSLTQIDSGMNGHSVVYQNYPGENPLISGGQTITGWQPAGDGSWKTFVGAGSPIRQLYVNNQRAVRARTNEPLPQYQKTDQGYFLSEPNISTWSNISDIEFVANNLWKQFRCPVESVVGSEIVMQQPCWDNAQIEVNTPMNSPTYIENAHELLDAPGEWYADRTSGWLFYYPYAGEDITSAEVIAPLLESLVRGVGTPDNPIHDIQFRGITFAYATWQGPSTNEGHVCVQANISYTGQSASLTKIPAGITFRSAHEIVFDRNIFTHLGAAGLMFEYGSQNNSIVGNHFVDISGNGLQVGDFDQPNTSNPLELTSSNTIANNYIQNIAQEYQDGVGMWFGYVQSSQIEHNEVSSIPYTGISIGWGWGNDDPTVARENHIENNYVHDHVQVLTDGGGIYSLSAQPDTVVANNVITGQVNAGGALYLDQGSRYITVENNAVFDNVRTALISGGEHTIRDNWWQNRYENDIWYFLPAFGPNTIENNHTISSEDEVPSDIIASAGLETDYQDVSSLTYPTNLRDTCSQTGQNIALTWNSARGSSSYELHIDDQTNNGDSADDGWFVAGSTDLVASLSDTSVDHAVTCGKSYRWWVNVPGDTTHVPTSLITCGCQPDTEAPSIPSNVSATSVSFSTATLQWDPSVDNTNVRGYDVYRNDIKIFFALTESFVDENLTPGTSYTYLINAVDDTGNTSASSSPLTINTPVEPLPPVVPAPTSQPSEVITPPSVPVKPLPPTEMLIPAASGGRSEVKRFSSTGKLVSRFFAYTSTFGGDVNVSSGDIDGDGTKEVITGPGSGGSAQIRIFTREGKIHSQFFAFPKSWRIGASVIAADLDGNGVDEVIVAPNLGTAHVRVFSYNRFKRRYDLVTQRFVFPASFRGGLNFAAGDLNDDGKSELIVAPAHSGGPQVRVYTYRPESRTLNLISQFFAYPSTHKTGVALATGDLDGDGKSEIITGAGAGREPLVRAFTPGGRQVLEYLALKRAHRGGIVVGAIQADSDSALELVVGPRAQAVSSISIVNVDARFTRLSQIRRFTAYQKGFLGGTRISGY